MKPLHKYISQLEPVRNILMHQPVTVSSNACSQMHVQIKRFLAYLQDLIPTLANIKYISDITPAKVGIKSCT